MCAGLLVLGALIAWATVRTPAPVDDTARPECAVHCGVTSPPLEPAPEAARPDTTG